MTMAHRSGQKWNIYYKCLKYNFLVAWLIYISSQTLLLKIIVKISFFVLPRLGNNKWQWKLVLPITCAAKIKMRVGTSLASTFAEAAQLCVVSLHVIPFTIRVMMLGNEQMNTFYNREARKTNLPWWISSWSFCLFHFSLSYNSLCPPFSSVVSFIIHPKLYWSSFQRFSSTIFIYHCFSFNFAVQI